MWPADNRPKGEFITMLHRRHKNEIGHWFSTKSLNTSEIHGVHVYINAMVKIKFNEPSRVYSNASFAPSDLTFYCFINMSQI